MKATIIYTTMFLTALLISQVASAIPIEPVCPLLPEVKKVKLTEAYNLEGMWMGIQRSNRFNTENDWSLVVFSDTQSDDKDVILADANEKLSKVWFSSGPAFAEEMKDRWVCGYYEGFTEMPWVVTVTPIIEPEIWKLRKVAHR